MIGRLAALVIGTLGVTGCAIPGGEPITGPSTIAVAANGSAVLLSPTCPNWRRDSREDFSNRSSSNFGCADAVNFLGQLADPRDAVRGRVGGEQDGGAAAGAVDRYRTRKTVPLSIGGSQAGAAAPAGGDPL